MSSETTEIDFFSDDVAFNADNAPATLERLTDLALKTTALNEEITALSVQLAEKSDSVKNILRNLIPTVMEELGMSEFKLVDGSKIEVKDHLQASLTEANKPAGFLWLEENEFDGIIKTKVHADFGKGEADDAKRARDALVAAGFSAELDRNVHPATLKAFVKERLEAGDSIPVDVFGVFQFKEAKITAPKVAKPRK